MRCVRDFVGWHDGKAALIKKNSTAPETDPAVTQAPEHWKAA